ncbi:MAG: hypothetical protein O2909_02600 [Chloroflexi bacterium]|nr:hypothetical protein [Chloroflexota bacterium]MDA1218313.1 hypothetical protein [Chloroflexota bacterium]
MSTANAAYENITIDEQLGHLEYVVTDEQLKLLQESVEYPEAFYPHIAVKEYLEVLRRKHGPISFISAKHKDYYYHPPIPNKRVQVTGWVRDKYERRGRNWLLVETLAIDEDGREIVRSEHTFLIGGVEKKAE